MTEETASTAEAEISFDEAMTRLEQIVRTMESGNTPLEEMISRFEQAKALAAICRKKLDELKRKVEILTKEPGQTQPVWTEMNTEGIVESKNDFLDGRNSDPEPESVPF